MFYSFARVSAVTEMKVSDYYAKSPKNWWFRFREKGGRVHEVPAHHKAQEYLDGYIDAGGHREERSSPLFRALSPSREITDRPLNRTTALRAIKRRAKKAGFEKFSNHSARASGITNFMTNNGELSAAQRMAGHADPRTTDSYNHASEEIERSEIERIQV